MSNTATLPAPHRTGPGAGPTVRRARAADASLPRHRFGAVPSSPARGVAPLPGRPARVRSSSLRLTRRGRVLVLLVLVSLLFAAFTMGRTASRAVEASGSPAAAAAAAAASTSAPVTTRTTVAPGETLWSIARRIAPARDPRDVVAQLRRLNDLATGGLDAGQQLVLPAVA